VAGRHPFGPIVKRRKDYLVNPVTGKPENISIPIRMNQNMTFGIEVPDDLFNIIAPFTERMDDALRPTGARVTMTSGGFGKDRARMLVTKDGEKCLTAFKTLHGLANQIREERVSEKVIVVRFNGVLPNSDVIALAQDSGMDNRAASDFMSKMKISFHDGSPLLFLNTYIAWRVGDKLYTDDTLRFPVHRDKGHFTVLPWTEQREAFFNNAVNALRDLTAGVMSFFMNLDDKLPQIDSGNLKAIGTTAKESA